MTSICYISMNMCLMQYRNLDFLGDMKYLHAKYSQSLTGSRNLRKLCNAKISPHTVVCVHNKFMPSICILHITFHASVQSLTCVDISVVASLAHTAGNDTHNGKRPPYSLCSPGCMLGDIQ